MTDKKLLRHGLALGLFLGGAAAPGALAAQQKHGDVNGDGVVSALDAQAILTGVVGLPLPQGYVVANGDSNCDAITGALDAQIVLSFVIGLNVSQYCVGQAFGTGAITVDITPTDTSVLINNGLRLRAVLTDAQGLHPERPIVWSTSNADLVAVDSARGDTAWVSNKGVAYDATAVITATADGASASTNVKVFRSYAGIVIQPQRGDTIWQLNGTQQFTARNRDSLGVISGSPSVTWSVLDTGIATVDASGLVTARTTGTTMVRIVSTSSSTLRDSVPVVVQLPAINSCTGEGGTLHASQTYGTPQTWSAATNPHYVSGSLTFNSGSRLAIEPGTLVCLGSGASLAFRSGSRLTAIGTATNPIIFTPTVNTDQWYSIQLGQNQSSTPTDTSTLKNVVLDRPLYGVLAYSDHVAMLDSVRVRQFGYYGVQLYAAGSRVSRSSIDSSRAGYSGTGAYVGAVTFEESQVRLRSGEGLGLFLYDSATVRQSTFTGGQLGVQAGGASIQSTRLNDLTIAGATHVGLELPYYYYGGVHPTSANVTISGSRLAYRGDIGSFAILFGDSARQANLVAANVTDTIELTGGILKQRSFAPLSTIRWQITSEIVVDTLAFLRIGPGTRFDVAWSTIRVRNTGRLEARGSATQPVWFRPRAGTQFYGLSFENPPAPGGFTPTPVDTSYLVNVRVDSAGGSCGFNTCAAINTHDRHMVVIDSSLIRMSLNGGVGLSTPGSRIVRTVIDTTGNPTSFYPALFLVGRTLAESTTVRRSGHTGVMIGGSASDSLRVRGLRIEDSEGVGLHAEGARVLGDSGSVVATANAYPYRGYIDSFGALARDSVAQLNFLGNTVDRAEIVGRSDRRFAGRAGRVDTLRVIPQLPWMLVNDAYVDTLAVLLPRPGARIGFWNGNLVFSRGGRLVARGTSQSKVVLEKWSATSGQFNGILFSNRGGTGLDTSSVINVSIRNAESCQGGAVTCAVLSTQNRHVLVVDSTSIDSTTYTAVALAAPGSRISRSVIDLAGQLTTYAALHLGGATLAESTTIRRARGTGVIAGGAATSLADTVRLRALRIENSGGIGLHAEGGRIIGDSASVIAVGNAYPFRGYVDNFAALARDSLSQLNFLGNTNDRAEIVGRSDRPFVGRAGRDSIRVIPQLQWLAINDVHFDSLAVLVPGPGARVGMWSGSMHFRSGATLLSRGTASSKVVFEKWSPTSGTFNGLQFNNPPGAVVDTSWIVNTDLRTIESCVGGQLRCATLAAFDRHVLVIDSSSVSQATYTAASLAAPGSRVSRSLIDVAGQVSGYPALELGRATLAESTTVQNARGTGVLVGGSATSASDTIRLRALTIRNSGGVGLHAEGGRIVGDLRSVTASGNAYPFRGYIDNFAVLARDSVSQDQLLGNADNRVEIVGRSDRPLLPALFDGPTLVSIPQLRMHFQSFTYVDTLAEFAPRPGSQIRFTGGGALVFNRGAVLNAVGTAADSIHFGPATASTSDFSGLLFNNPGAATDGFATDPIALSTLSYVNVDSASGASGGAFGSFAAVNSADRHRLSISNSRLHRNFGGAIHLGAKYSSLTDVRVDTTGNPNASTFAVALNDSTTATNLVVNRSGQVGIRVDGNGIVMTDVTVNNSVGNGINITNNATAANGGSQGLQLSDFTVDSTGGVGVSIQASGVQLSSCTVRNGISHGFATNTGLPSVVIANCNILNNGRNGTGLGVSNADVSNVANQINAANNFWGLDAQGAPITPTVGGVNGVSANVIFDPIARGSIAH